MSKQAPAQKKKNSRAALVLIGFLVVIFATPTALLILGGLIPTYAAWMMDRERGKLTTVTIGALNVAALTPLLLELWDDHSIDTALKMLASPFLWILMLGGAGVGWVLAQVVPSIIVTIISARNKMKLETIRARQKQLTDEWGTSITESHR